MNAKTTNNDFDFSDNPIDEEVIDQKIDLIFSSVEDSKGNQFEPLEEDQYLLSVYEAKLIERNAYQSDELRKFIQIQFVVENNISGKPIKDINGEKQEDGFRRLWETLDTTALGFKNDGTPSKTRACLCALLEQDVNEAFTFSEISDLEGKTCKGFITVAKKKDGTLKNKILKYSNYEA